VCGGDHPDPEYGAVGTDRDGAVDTCLLRGHPPVGGGKPFIYIVLQNLLSVKISF
jgi:hypothetical protein